MLHFTLCLLIGLLIALTLLAISPTSHSPSGVVQLFSFSLFVSFGFLMLGRHRLETAQQKKHHSA